MTPEVKAAIERLKEQRDNGAEWIARDPSYHWSCGSYGTGWIADLMLIRDMLLDQHTQQPVDWPTEPGWWWMDVRAPSVVLVWCYGPMIAWDGEKYPRGAFHYARFLPAHVPTFPPREAT